MNLFDNRSGFIFAVLVVLSVQLASVAHANPQGPQVMHGVVGFAQPDAATLNITTSPNAVIAR